MRVVVLLVLGVAAGACSSGSGAGGGSGGGPNPNDYGHERAELRCRRVYECCPLGATSGEQNFGTDLASCTAKLAPEQAQNVSEQLKAGLTFDSACAKSVSAVTEAALCRVDPDPDFIDALCAMPCHGDPFYGALAAGDACEQNDDQCGFGLVCLNGKCGDFCAKSAEGEPCFLYCADGLICDPTTSICRAVPDPGESCPDGLCAATAYCSSSGVCSPEIAIGAACTQDLACESGYCKPSATSSAACAVPPGVGESCSSVCGDGLVCFDNSCVKPGGIGESCTTTAPCEQQLFCQEGHCWLGTGC